MAGGATAGVSPEEAGNTRLSLLLAAAMFVLVVDTSLMNVSISAVVKDLDGSLPQLVSIDASSSDLMLRIQERGADATGSEYWDRCRLARHGA